MKHLRKTAALLLAVLLSVSLLAACGSKGNDFTCADVINRSDDQQRWLQSPVSELVINPNAVGAEKGAADPRDMTVNPLSFGVKDASGKIVATYDDAFFLLEYKSANGLGAEVLRTLEWDTCKGLSKVDNMSAGTQLYFSIPEGFGKTIEVKMPMNWKIDANDENLYLRMEIAEMPETSDAYVSYNPVIYDPGTHQVSLGTFRELGTYLMHVKTAVEENEAKILEDGNDFSICLQVKAPGTYRISDFSLIRLSTGYQPSAKAPSTVWSPYYMKASVEYPNGSSVETTDFFYESNTIVRKVLPIANGDLCLAGKIYGTCSYDSKEKALTFDNGSTKYVLFLKRNGTIEYYATYEDLLAGENILETASGAAYWALKMNGLIPTEESNAYFFGISASATKSIEELLAEGRKAISSNKAKKAFTELEEYWNAYIAANDVSDYITVIPESK